MWRDSRQLSDEEKALFLLRDSVDEPSQKAESPSGEEQLEAEGSVLCGAEGGGGGTT